MSVLKIVKMGHPALSRPAEGVSDPSHPEITRLIDDMVETMLDAPGIGLAAPQVGVSRRVVIYCVPARRGGDTDDVPVTALINPVLTPVGEEMDVDTEGCLSLPGLSGQVSRYTRIRVQALAMDGADTAFEADGFHARVLQHECDHLDGILYPQRMDDLSTFGYTEELDKRSADVTGGNL